MQLTGGADCGTLREDEKSGMDGGLYYGGTHIGVER